jgi:hypothetical protein
LHFLHRIASLCVGPHAIKCRLQTGSEEMVLVSPGRDVSHNRLNRHDAQRRISLGVLGRYSEDGRRAG